MISEQDLDKLLQRVAEGSVAPDEARCELRAILEVDDVVLDLERDVRCGQPEVVFGAGKSNSQLRSIVASMAAAGRNVLITRIRAEIAKELAMGYESAQSDEVARTWQLLSAPVPRRCGCVAVVSAGGVGCTGIWGGDADPGVLWGGSRADLRCGSGWHSPAGASARRDSGM